jgi:type VI protein secretion system component VasF
VLGNRVTQPTDVAATVQSAAATIGRIARRVPTEAAFPLGLLALLALVGAFLLVQHRIDRRDPKLALAPVTQTLLEFGPPPGTATAR